MAAGSGGDPVASVGIWVRDNTSRHMGTPGPKMGGRGDGGGGGGGGDPYVCDTGFKADQLQPDSSPDPL